MAELAPSHIILGGQSHPWDVYSPGSLAGAFDIIRHAEQPVLGVCGGHQQIALCYGAAVGLGCSARCRIGSPCGRLTASRPVFGLQFHPELFDDDHPHGQAILDAFLGL